MTRETAIKIIDKLEDFKRDYSSEYNIPYLEHESELTNLSKMVNIVLDASKSDENVEQLKAEITRLSDPFLHAPDWAEWFAVDADGCGYFYDMAPYQNGNKWFQRGFKAKLFHCGYYPELAANWKNSKVKRVREQKP